MLKLHRNWNQHQNTAEKYYLMIETNVTSTRSLIEKVKCVRRREYESTQFSRNLVFQTHSFVSPNFSFFFFWQKGNIFLATNLSETGFSRGKISNELLFSSVIFSLNALPPLFDLELEANTRFLRCIFGLSLHLLYHTFRSYITHTDTKSIFWLAQTTPPFVLHFVIMCCFQHSLSNLLSTNAIVYDHIFFLLLQRQF